MLNDFCYKCNYNCKTTSDDCKCDTYEDERYYLDKYQCLQCSSNCINYYSDNNCYNCEENYFLYDGYCYQCSINCKTTEDNCECDSCDDGYYLHIYTYLSMFTMQ